MEWNTDKIQADLITALLASNFPHKKSVSITLEKDPDGGNYCREIYIVLSSKREKNSISITGFNTDYDNDLSSVDTPAQDIEYVEIRTFDSDSDGGLPKQSSKEIRELYFLAVDYFNTKEIQIVDQLKKYF